MSTEQYKPDQETEQVKATKLHPIAGDLADYQESLGDGSTTFRGLVTGFSEVDNLISGLDRFILLAGRSGAGKTTLASQLALGVAEHTPVLFYSLEMGKSDIITMFIQSLAKGLYRNDIELRGNDPSLESDKKAKLAEAVKTLEPLAKNIYIRDATNGIPRIADPKDGNSILNTVESLKAKHNAERVLVVIDSVQDVVPMASNQVQAEIQTVQELTEVQQKTGATILVIAQKNKGSINSIDSYGDVMGSMSFIHKPNTVIEIITAKELLAKSKDDGDRTREIERVIEMDAKDGKSKPMYLNIIKGRYTGTSAIPLQYYGAYGYYEGGIATKYKSVYDLMSK